MMIPGWLPLPKVNTGNAYSLVFAVIPVIRTLPEVLPSSIRIYPSLLYQIIAGIFRTLWVEQYLSVGEVDCGLIKRACLFETLE